MSTNGRRAVLRPVVDDLKGVFGDRLVAVVAYGWRQTGPVPSLALVRDMAVEDLNACAARTSAWRRAGAATPLLLTTADFARSLDAFPIEYGEIMHSHETLVGDDPFAGLTVRTDDLRRACEVQVKSHLLHLREDYLEGGARPSEIDVLVRESAPALAAILRPLARLNGAPASSSADLSHFATRTLGLDSHVVGDLLALADQTGPSAIDAVKLFPAYLAAMERLADFVDRWRPA